MEDLIVKIIGLGITTGLLATLFKLLKTKILEYKQRRISEKNSKALSEDAQIYMSLVDLGQEYDFNYSHIFRLHNSGKELTPTSKKKLSIEWEFPGSKIQRSKLRQWQDRLASGEMKRSISFINTDEELYIGDIEGEPTKGLREIYNINHGKELYFVKVGWTLNDSFWFLGFQRDVNDKHRMPLTYDQKEVIKYRCSEIGKLIE